MIKSGTTTFSDMYIFEEETAQAANQAGMRCLLAKSSSTFLPQFKTPAEGLAYTEELIQRWADHPLVNIMVEPHSLYTCSPELLKSAKNLADRYQVPPVYTFLEIGGSETVERKIGKRATTSQGDGNCSTRGSLPFIAS